MRMLVVWCPDWSVTAAEIVDGVAAGGAVAVFRAGRVVACSEAARREGVRQGLRRRDAQGRCPQLVVVDYDAGRDARAFEPVVAAVEDVAIGVEILRAGTCALAARGPSRYFGGEEAAAERIVERIAETCAVESQVGVAEGVFAAGLAARAGLMIPDGETAGFLGGQPLATLGRPELVDLLKRLGITTLGEFAALPPGDVLTRFGFAGALAHRLAGGAEHRPLAVRQPPPDLAVEDTYDEVLERVDVAAFAGRVLAERLHDKLSAYGLACTRLGIEAVTANGQELHRVWRHDGNLTAAAIAERVRWQLDGWLTGARRGGPARPTAGLVRLRLIPDGLLVHLGMQPGLWGDVGAGRERAHRAVSRVQGLLGPEAVVTPVIDGGRSAGDQIRFVPWGDERVAERAAAVHEDPVPDVRAVPLLSFEAEPAVVLPMQVRRKADQLAVRGDGDLRGEESRVDESPWITGGGEVPRLTADGRLAPAIGSTASVDSTASADDGLLVVEIKPGRKRGKGRAAKPPELPPWPGRIPRPAPAVVLDHPLPAMVLDGYGAVVGVSARLDLSGEPAALVIDRGQPIPIAGWSGPWPVDERWWAPAEARRQARFQVALADGRALLLTLAGGQWHVEAVYD